MIVYKAHPKPVHALAFSPDGRFLASAGDEKVRLWSLADRQIVHELPGSYIYSPLCFSLDGSVLARGGYGVNAWLLPDNARGILAVKEHADSIAFAPDGALLVAHGGEGKLSHWSMPDGEALPVQGAWCATRQSTSGAMFPTGGAAFSPDGKLFASCWGISGKRGFARTSVSDPGPPIRLWDAKTGAQRVALPTDVFAHPEVIRFSPDGKRLAGLYCYLLRVWDVNTATMIAAKQVSEKHFKDCVFLPDGRRLITVSNDEVARVWRTDTWTETDAYEWKIGKLSCVAVSPDGCLLAAGGSTGKIVLWDAF